MATLVHLKQNGPCLSRRRQWRRPLFWLWLLASGCAFPALQAQVFINEILFNPPGNPDTTNEFIELRGPPNCVLSNGTYFVSVAGNLEDSPGTIQNAFDLSGRMIGGNGFLVLLQKDSLYTANAGATVLVNTGTGDGWGNGSTSSIGHRGRSGQSQINLQNPSVTFFLIRSPVYPAPGTSIDANTNGVPDGTYTNWTVLDSVGVLDNTGAGDFAYGRINYRRNPASGATGTIVSISFTPGYVGRSSNTTGSTSNDWVASDTLAGSPPNWTLDSVNTYPASYTSRALNHIGAPNFNAPALDGVVLIESGGSTDVTEGSGTDSYTIRLNTTPSGRVVIQASTVSPLQISIDGGATFDTSGNLAFSNTTPQTVIVRAPNDNVVDISPSVVPVTHRVFLTLDATHYPSTTVIPTVQAKVTETESVLLNELKVNPPGSNDEPDEYIELRGPPDAMLNNVYFLAIEGNAGKDPGKANVVIDLTSQQLGSSGLLLIVADDHPYSTPPGSSVMLDSHLNAAGGGLANSSVSFLLVSSPAPILEGDDLDHGDNGILEGLPDGVTILDAVGWRDGDTNDVIYGGAMLCDTPNPPDAAVRFPNNNTPQSAAAWFHGELFGDDPTTLVFDSANVSPNFPPGATLSPGEVNTIPPSITGIGPISGVIGDPTNPNVVFTVADPAINPDALVVTATSDNPGVVPDANLILTAGPNGTRTLAINPVGVGYAIITVTVWNGTLAGETSFPYAASRDTRGGGRFHTGSSDASAALALDANYMLVGDDQNQILRMFPRNLSGPPLNAFDFKPYLDLSAQEQGEVDIEASTRVGNRLYWLGSHSHNNLAESRTNRTRVFATDLSGSGANALLSFVGYYKYLKTDLTNWDAAGLHGKGPNYYGLAASAAYEVDPKAADGSGFNFEGLTMAPGSTTTAWLGFRAPLVPVTNRSKALIVPVLNFPTLVANGGGPGLAVFGTPIELNLGCRAIRSIEATTGGVLIATGPPGKDSDWMPKDYKLFAWSGNPADQPQERAADLSGLQPEAIVELPPPPWNASSPVQVLTDNGNTVYYGDDIPAKHLTIPAFKKFRSDWVALGPAVTPRPCIKAFSRSGNLLTLSWCSAVGLTYRVQFKSNLNETGWTDVTGNITAVDAVTTITYPIGPPPQGFYRVAVWP